MADKDEPQTAQSYSFTPDAVFRHTETWWKERGVAARTASSELDLIARRADELLANNNWGDFDEGKHVYAMFQSSVDTWIASLRLRSASASNLAIACFDAAKVIATADYKAAEGISQLQSEYF